jgi:hypothetical protein
MSENGERCEMAISSMQRKVDLNADLDDDTTRIERVVRPQFPERRE